MKSFSKVKCVTIRSLQSKLRFWFSRAAAFSKAVVNDTNKGGKTGSEAEGMGVLDHRKMLPLEIVHYKQNQ